MSNHQTISVTACSPHVGALIDNIDLRDELSDRQVVDLRRALLDHGVIFFHNQPIDFEQHRRLAMYFGPLHIHVGGKGTASRPAEGYPEIRRQHFDGNSKRVSGEVWHTDQSCAPIPPMGSILHQHKVPPKGGGDTLFASMYAAYDALSPKIRAMLDGLTAIHDGAILFDANSGTDYPQATHPVVVRHPETGRKLLYVNRGQTTRINELPRAESDHILALLFEHIERPEWQMRFRWSDHSIAFWDNRCTQHRAIWDYWPEVRTGYRIQIQGDAAPVAG